MTTVSLAKTPAMLGRGVQDGLPSEAYHSHRAVSASSLKRLLPPSTPAHYRYGEDKTSDALDFGKVAHHLVLGEGDRYVVRPSKWSDWRTKDAQAWRTAQEADGLVVVTRDLLDQAEAMVEVLRAHPAGAYFTDGRPEQSLFWTDPETGLKCRARPDWLPTLRPDRRLVVPDYKTARTAEPREFGKAAADRLYYLSAAFYREGCRQLGLDDDAQIVLVAQEKTPPYVVQPYLFDEDDLQLGASLMRKGLRLLADCLAADKWPAYAEHPTTLELPTYHRISVEDYVYTDDMEVSS
jgi:hypothetical protein